MPTHDRAPDPVTLAAVGIGYREMLAISRESDAWRFRPGTPDRWIQTETGEVVTAATPEGVPDDYVYVRPDEEVGDEYDVVESDSGGTYRSPNPTDSDGDAGGSDASDSGPDLPGDPPEDMSVFEARNYIFDQSGPSGEGGFNKNEDAAVAIVKAGNADPDACGPKRRASADERSGKERRHNRTRTPPGRVMDDRPRLRGVGCEGRAQVKDAGGRRVTYGRDRR